MVLHRQILACLPRPAHKYEGAYPLGFEQRIPKIIQTKDYLHLFSGKSKTGHRVDIRLDVNADTIADCRNLPFPDNHFSGAMCDPMYEQKFADNLYKQEMPKWGEWTKEVVRVVKTGGLIGIMHNYELNRLSGCQYWDVHYIANRPKHYPRIVTVFIKTQNPRFCQLDGSEINFFSLSKIGSFYYNVLTKPIIVHIGAIPIKNTCTIPLVRKNESLASCATSNQPVPVSAIVYLGSFSIIVIVAKSTGGGINPTIPPITNSIKIIEVNPTIILSLIVATNCIFLSNKVAIKSSTIGNLGKRQW